MQFMNFWRRPTVATISSRRSKRHGVAARHRRGLHRPEVLEQRTVLAASIGFVWNDLNTDGIQNGGELGVAGVTVQLLDSSNAVLDTKLTNGTGNYSFTGLAAGTYSIKTTAPVSFGFSPADQGSNNAIDSDHLSYLGRTASFTLGAADTFTADIGLAQKFTVDIPDVTWVSSPTVPLDGYVDVKFTNVPGGSFIDKLSAYNAGIILTPVGGASGGVTWFVNSTTMTHDAIEPNSAIFPGQDPQDFTSSGNLHYVADNLSASAENQILNNQGIFRLQFTIPAGATGDYQLTFDPDNTLFFDALSNQITNLDLSAGTIHLVPEISVTAVTTTANEGTGGTLSRSFNVTLSHPSTQTITVLVNTVDGMATAADGDFTPIVNQLLTFTPGTQSLPVTVSVNADNKVELDESFSLALSNAINAVIQGTPAVTTLVNDDQATISIDSVSTAEGNSGTAPLVFTVTLSNPVDTSVSVSLTAANVTALLGSDYALTGTPTVTFAANTTTAQTYTYNITGDNTVELTETFSVTLAPPVAAGRNVVLGTAVGIGTITNDDSTSIVVTNAAGNASIFEGQLAGSVQELTFLVSLTNPVDVPVGITIGTALGTPGPGIALADDFTTTSQTHSFTAGTTTAYEFKVALTRDNIVELDELFNVVLSGLNVATGYAPSITTSSTATGTIRNDDTATISVTSDLANASITEGQTGDSNILTFMVTLSNPVDEATTVTISTALLTPGVGIAAANDFIANSVTHTFGIGQTTFSFPVTLSGDLLNEVNETFAVNLSPPVSNRSVTLGSNAIGTIINDDFDVTGPKVQGIYVRSTSWSASYLNRLAANGVGDAILGYRLDVGTAQLDDLPWVNLNQISIVFNEDVVISNDDIKLRGINVPEHTLIGSYSNTTTRIATWNLAASTVIARDKLLVQLSSNATTGVLDINGNPLDGNSLTNNTSYSAFPTGDGVNGGDLTFRFDVLPGNTDRGVAPGTGGVFGGDVTRVRDTQFSLISNSAYPIYFDVNGDGIINGGDVNNVRDRQFTLLPVGEPVNTSFASFFAQLADEESPTQGSTVAGSAVVPASEITLVQTPQVQPSQAELYWYALGSSPQESSSDVLTSGKRKAWLNT